MFQQTSLDLSAPTQPSICILPLIGRSFFSFSRWDLRRPLIWRMGDQCRSIDRTTLLGRPVHFCSPIVVDLVHPWTNVLMYTCYPACLFARPPVRLPVSALAGHVSLSLSWAMMMMGCWKEKNPTFESTYHSNTCPVASVFFGHHPTSFPLIQSWCTPHWLSYPPSHPLHSSSVHYPASAQGCDLFFSAVFISTLRHLLSLFIQCSPK